MEPTETYKAWLAGFFDGEGTVCFATGRTPHRRDNPRVVIYQKNQLDLLLEIRDFYGGTVRFLRSGFSKGVHGLFIERKAEVLKFLTDLVPYLRVKRHKAELMIAFCSINVGRNQNGHVEEKFQRAQIADEFRNLQ